MKEVILLILLLSAVKVHSQIFTKLTVGEPVNDGGDSRAANWIDYDNDGDLDLFFTNGPQSGENNFFYINNGDGTFSKDDQIEIAKDGRASDGSSWGDYDNDGDVDLFVANWWNHNNLLYRNNGDKTFTLITDTQIYTDRGYSETGSWGDYNRDGLLDLYVCNSYSNFRNFLYKNNGDGTFEKIITGEIVTDVKVSRNIDWIDFDSDGDDDAFVANEENQNEDLYLNDGSGSFTKASSGALLSAGGSSAGSIWEDFDNDGDFDVFITNYNNQNNFYFMNNGDGNFVRVTTGVFVTDGGNSFGSTAGDVDNDGDVDLYVANAFTGSKATNNFLYLNNGDGTFEKVTSDPSVNDGGWSYGCALGDYNKDGFLDLAIGKCFNKNENNSVFENNGGENNWLILDLEGTISNRSAIGAVVKIKANINGNEVVQMRRVAGQNGYCGQTLQLHFGLGDAGQADSIIINWPSGRISNLGAYAANQFLKIAEDTTLTGEADLKNQLTGFKLNQNYPNPFNPSTTISFSIPERSYTQLKLFDSLGNEVSTLISDEREAGEHKVVLDINSELSTLSSGIYFYKLIAGTFTETKKLALMK